MQDRDRGWGAGEKAATYACLVVSEFFDGDIKRADRSPAKEALKLHLQQDTSLEAFKFTRARMGERELGNKAN